jgi:RNA polymerase sigma-70 factor (ECF subfamily)
MRNGIPNEQELLRRALHLDTTALEEIYDYYSPGLYRYAMRVLGHASLAENCVAETFARFLKALQTHQGPRDHLQAYLYRIAHNWILDLYREHEKTIELSETMHSEKLPEEEAVEYIQQQQIRKMLRGLAPDQQKKIALKYLEDWSNEEIARVLHKPAGVVRSLRHRILANLQKLFMKNTDE